MEIKTSWWFGRLPEGHLKIGVSRGTPRGTPAGYRMYRPLQPGPWFNSVSVEVYKQRYFGHLKTLNPTVVVNELAAMAQDRTPVLVCYENPYKDHDWCHRGMISAWLHDTIALEVRELGREKDGYGWTHPKLPPQYRRHDLPPAQPIDVEPFMGREAVDPQTGVIWTVVGRDPDHPDQAVISDGEAKRSISQAVLIARFSPSL